MSATEHRSHYQVTFAVLAVSVSAFALLQSLVAPVLAEIQADLHTSQTTVTWVLTAYLLSASVFTPIVGRVGDKVGKERMLVVALVALAVGSLIAALATSIGLMIVGRVIQGVGGGVLPLSFGIIRDEFPEKKIPGAVAAVASLAAVGAGVGLVLAGRSSASFDYHWLFWFPMIVTAAAAVATVVFVPESPVRTPGKISVLPAVLLSAWLVALLLALSQGRSGVGASAAVLGLLVAAVVLAVALGVGREPLGVAADRHADDATAGGVDDEPGRAARRVRDVRVVRLPATVQPDAQRCGLRLRGVDHRVRPDPAAVVGDDVPGRDVLRTRGPPDRPQVRRRHRVADRRCRHGDGGLRPRPPLAAGPGQQRHGCGVGLVFACLSNLIVAAVPPEQTGVASGMNANIRTVGGSIGAAVMATIVTASVFAERPAARVRLHPRVRRCSWS